MFRLRRKKGQGAIEYLFMIAAALVIILIAVRYVSNSGQQATNQGDLAMLQSQAELVKSNYEANGYWEDAQVSKDKDKNELKVDTDGDNTAENTITFDKNQYQELYKAKIDWTKVSTLYTKCQAGNVTACQVFGVLSGNSK